MNRITRTLTALLVTPAAVVGLAGVASAAPVAPVTNTSDGHALAVRCSGQEGYIAPDHTTVQDFPACRGAQLQVRADDGFNTFCRGRNARGRLVFDRFYDAGWYGYGDGLSNGRCRVIPDGVDDPDGATHQLGRVRVSARHGMRLVALSLANR